MKSDIPLKANPEKQKVHFKFIDGLRGIAALWVVLFHADPHGRISQFTSVLPQWLVYILFEKGSLGIAIFFVLSGFLIAYSLQNARINFSFLKSFVLRRFVRLNPTYYVAIITTIVISFIAAYFKGQEFAPMGEPLSFPRLIAHLFYLQDILKLQHIDEVYWTLCLEVQHYLVFCVLIVLTQWIDSRWKTNWGKAIIFIPSAGIAALYAMGILTYEGRPTTLLPLWHSFLLGTFAYWTWRNQMKSWLFYFYVAVLISAGRLPSSGFVITGSVVAILLLEISRTNRMGTLLNWRWLQFVSKISYSLYLTHVAILGGVYFVGLKLLKHSVWSEFICLVAGIGVCIGFATLMWQFVEKPSIKWSKKLKSNNLAQ